MKLSTLAAAVALAFTTSAYAQTGAIQTATVSSETQYLSRVSPRFGTLAGSDTNLQSLVHGLRTGSPVELAGAPGTESIMFMPATRPMGYGNITRALDIANRQLAAQGITNPTPQQLNAALNGGTITTANGPATMTGVLALRSQGMGWGKIAQTVGVHPGIGKTSATATGATATSTTSTSTGVTTAARTTTNATVSTGGKGITTASGAASSQGHAHASSTARGHGVVSASGATAGSGVTSAGGSQGRGNGHGNTNGRGGKP